MRSFLLAIVLATGTLLAAYLYQQVFVEGNMGPAAIVGAAVLGAIFAAALITWLLYGTRHRDLVSKLWLAATATVVAYFVVDFAAGKILIQRLSPPLVADAYRHHKLVPDSHAEFRQRDFSYVQRVNHLGLRGREVAVAKPAGTFRIVMLGDSFTMGKGVEDDQTFSVLLERALQQASAACGGGPIEVINAGVDSYAPVLELIQLKRELQPLAPDLVVVNLDVSDLAQEQAYRRVGVRDAEGEIVAVPQRVGGESLYERIRSWTELNLFFTRVLLFYANRAMNYRDVSVRGMVSEANLEITAHTLAGTDDRQQWWADIFDSIRRIKAHADANGMEFVLTLYPWAHQISDTQWVPGRYAFMPEDAKPSERTHETVRELSAAGGIALADLFPAFRARVGSEKLYFDHDMHWTPAGQQVMAKGLEEYLWPRFRERWCANPATR